MPLEPGPMQVISNFHQSKDEVLDDIKKLDLWPTVYVSERMDELPPHWHDVDNCGYVMEGSSYVINENGEVFDNPGIYVTDAAALPRGPAGPPSMTIAAWANLVAEKFIARYRASGN